MVKAAQTGGQLDIGIGELLGAYGRQCFTKCLSMKRAQKDEKQGSNSKGVTKKEWHREMKILGIT